MLTDASACCLFTAVLAACGTTACERLPVVTRALPARDADITLVLVPHDWRVEARARGESADEATYHARTEQSWRGLRERLRVLGERSPASEDDPFARTATLALRAPGDTPFAVVQQVISEAARSGLHRLEFVVMTPAAGGAERRLETWLRVERSGSRLPMPREAWIHLGARAGTSALVRRTCEVRRLRLDPDDGPAVETTERLPFDPVPGVEFSADTAGNEALRVFLAAWLVESARLQGSPASARIDADADVPLQEILALVEVVRAAGLEQVDFAAR